MMRQTHLWLLTLTVALLATACGEDAPPEHKTTDVVEGEGDTVFVPPTGIIRQVHLTADELVPQAASEADLQAALDAAMGKAGSTTLTAAGKLTSSDGTTALWGEVTSANGARYTAFELCGDPCQYGVQTIDDGALTWEDTSGGAMDVATLGEPALLKKLPNFDFAEPTDLVSPYLETLDGTIPDVPLTGRRFIIASVFGDALYGYGFDDLAAMAEATGYYDEVVEARFLEADDLTGFIATLTTFDVLVYVGQSVEMKAMTADPPVYKTIGLTANRGGFGDETVDMSELGVAVDQNPFKAQAGAGLMVLVAGNSLGDPTAEEPFDGQVHQLLRTGAQHIVGFLGNPPATLAKLATEVMFESLFAGETLGDAIAAGQGELSGDYAAISFTTDTDTDTDWTIAFDEDAFWASTKVGVAPTTGRLVTYLSIEQSVCNGAPGESGMETFFFRSITYDGRTFTGTDLNDDPDDPDNQRDITCHGIIGGVSKGDPLLIRIEGMPSPAMKDIVLYASATVTSSELVEDPTRTFLKVYFTGNATATAYENILGEECKIVLTDTTTSVLETLTSSKSWIEIDLPPQEEL